MNKTVAIMTGAFVPENRQVTLFKHLELVNYLGNKPPRLRR